MPTTAAEIHEWFKEGKRQGMRYMIVVCDTFDYEDYPVYCKDDATCLLQYTEHSGKNMQRVMEVYNLALGWPAQKDGRVMNLPD